MSALRAKFREATARINLGELSAGRKILEDLQRKGDGKPNLRLSQDRPS